jgi:hypothetical protein
MRKEFMLAVLCVAGSAQAADHSFYLGGGKTSNEFHVEDSLDNRDGGFKAIAGVSWHDRLDFELSHSDHGRGTLPSGIACVALAGVECPATSHLDARSTSAFAVAKLGGRLAFIGKAGFSFSESRLRAPGVPAFDTRDTHVDLAWGVGLQAALGRLAIRAEFERYRLIRDRRLDAASLNFLYTFL